MKEKFEGWEAKIPGCYRLANDKVSSSMLQVTEGYSYNTPFNRYRDTYWIVERPPVRSKETGRKSIFHLMEDGIRGKVNKFGNSRL